LGGLFRRLDAQDLEPLPAAALCAGYCFVRLLTRRRANAPRKMRLAPARRSELGSAVPASMCADTGEMNPIDATLPKMPARRNKFKVFCLSV